MVSDGISPEVSQIVHDPASHVPEQLRQKFPLARQILTLLGGWGDIKKKDSLGIDVGRANQECLAIIINKTPLEKVEKLKRYLDFLINVAERQAELRSLAYEIQIEDLKALGLSLQLGEILRFKSRREEIDRRFEKRTVNQSFVNGLSFPLRERDIDRVIRAYKIPAEKLRGTSLDSSLINETLEEINKVQTPPPASLQAE